MNIEEYVKKANEYGFILSANAISFLKKHLEKLTINDFEEFLKKHNSIVIKEEDIKKLLGSDEILTIDEFKEVEIPEKIKIIYDPGKFTRPGSGLQEYEKMFRDRYTKLSSKLKSIVKVNSFKKISEIMTNKYRNSEVIISGLIYRKRIYSDRIMLEIEDPTGSIVSYAYKKSNPKIYDTIMKAPLDVVVSLKLFINSKGRAVVEEIYLPRVKSGRVNKPENEAVYAAFISDLHIGSRMFNYEHFDKFVELVRGNIHNEIVRNMVLRLKYILIAGDLVDGVGVYKGQEKDLQINDIYEQYNEAYKILKKLPTRYKIIIIPGNHDASRSALPQPPIFKKFAEKFYNDPQFILLGNPVNVGLHDVNTVIYHGDFVQDLLSSIPGIDQGDVNAAIKILLDYSHLAPQVGLSTKIAPEQRDHLILKDGINILHYGHTHRFNISKIYGILCINSGTFQNQTDYQKMMKIEPDLGKIAFVNLTNLTPYIVRIVE